MKTLIAMTTAGVLALSPAMAEEGDMGEGINLLEEGAKLFMRGLMSEMEPAFNELEGLIGEMQYYHSPEIMPNGDIIIRRKRDGEVTVEPEGEIDL